MARGDIEATIRIEGLAAFRRDLKRISPEAANELREDLKDIARDVASRADRSAGASSFSYRGTATAGLRAQVRRTGAKPHVARFIELGFHPRGGNTFVPGRNIVGGVLADREDEIVDQIGDAINDAARRAGWH